MDQIDFAISAELKRIVGVGMNDRFPIMSGVVKEVNEGEGTCSVVLTIDGDIPTEGVLLNAVSGAMNGMVVVPQVNSQCWVAEIDGPGKWGLIRAAEVKKITIVADVVVEFNGGENGGLTKTPTLQTELNKLKTLVQHIVTVINSAPILEPGSGSPSALQAALQTAIATDVLPDFSDIENDKVKH